MAENSQGTQREEQGSQKKPKLVLDATKICPYCNEEGHSIYTSGDCLANVKNASYNKEAGQKAADKK